ncbi:LOG family protein [Streptomyces sp. NPDC052236]|uniref:LOG family protein n=1 Tax=Streptomyces sp. NPDC052236 TaxID=3365686 RepID=UPI0037CF110A
MLVNPVLVNSFTVFCGSSPGRVGTHLRAAATLGRTIAEARLRLVYGGAAVGLMGAVADAALSAGGTVIGVMPECLTPFEIAHTGYPGETPELFEDTKNFLVNEYEGPFALYVFMLNDETMPVWQDAERFGLEVFDADGDAEQWSHTGMDSATARRLQLETLREVRWKNDRAMQRTWQHDYELPLLPGRSTAENSAVEKLVDRLGMASADFPDAAEAAGRRPPGTAARGSGGTWRDLGGHLPVDPHRGTHLPLIGRVAVRRLQR